MNLEMDMEESGLDAKSSVLKKLIKELMLIDSGKAGLAEEEPALQLDSESVGEGSPDEEMLEVSSETVKVKEPEEEDLEDIANYKRV